MKSDVATVTAKGQIVIPARLRRELGIRKGTKISFRAQKNSLILEPLTEEYIRSLRGSLKGKPSILEVLLEGRRQEREL